MLIIGLISWALLIPAALLVRKAPAQATAGPAEMTGDAAGRMRTSPGLVTVPFCLPHENGSRRLINLTNVSNL